MAKTPFQKAFDFVGSTKPTVVTIKNKRIFSIKNGVTISCPIEEDLELCADYESLKLALSASKDESAVTVENFKLSVNTEDVNIYVGLREIETPEPDPMISLVDESLANCLVEMSQFLKRSKDNEAIFHLLIQGQSIISSDGNSIFEWFHGQGLPTQMQVSKVFCDAIKKAKGREIWGAGACEGSITLHFSEGSWIKGENWPGEWLPWEALLPVPVNTAEIPTGLGSALDAVKRFCGDGWVWLGQGKVFSDPGAGSGASREVPGMELEGVFSHSAMAFAAKHCSTWELTEKGHLAVFGHNVRGLIGAYQQ